MSFYYIRLCRAVNWGIVHLILVGLISSAFQADTVHKKTPFRNASFRLLPGKGFGEACLLNVGSNWRIRLVGYARRKVNVCRY